MGGHTGEKSLACTVCYKPFSRKNNLVDHLNKHYDIKPWECSLCKERFFTRDAVTAHLKDKICEDDHKIPEGASQQDFIVKKDVTHLKKQVVNLVVEEDLLQDMVIQVEESSHLAAT